MQVLKMRTLRWMCEHMKRNKIIYKDIIRFSESNPGGGHNAKNETDMALAREERMCKHSDYEV